MAMYTPVRKSMPPCYRGNRGACLAGEGLFGDPHAQLSIDAAVVRKEEGAQRINWE